MKLIDEEKVDVASLENSKLHYIMAFSEELHKDADIDFKKGVQFAETELSNLAIELIESIFDYEKESKSRICEFDRTPESVFEKFIEQRKKL